MSCMIGRMLQASTATLVRDGTAPMPTKPGMLSYVEAAMQCWGERGVEALIEFVGPEVEWHPHDADRPMRGPEVLEWVRALQAAGVTRSISEPTFTELCGCVLVSVAVRDFHGHGFMETRRTLLYEFAGASLVRIRAFGSRAEAEATAAGRPA